MKMGISILATFLKINEKEKANSFFQMVIFMKALGKTTKRTGKVYLPTQMVTSTLVGLKMIKKMDKGSSNFKIRTFTKANSITTKKMVKAYKST